MKTQVSWLVTDRETDRQTRTDRRTANIERQTTSSNTNQRMPRKDDIGSWCRRRPNDCHSARLHPRRERNDSNSRQECSYRGRIEAATATASCSDSFLRSQDCDDLVLRGGGKGDNSWYWRLLSRVFLYNQKFTLNTVVWDISSLHPYNLFGARHRTRDAVGFPNIVVGAQCNWPTQMFL